MENTEWIEYEGFKIESLVNGKFTVRQDGREAFIASDYEED